MHRVITKSSNFIETRFVNFFAPAINLRLSWAPITLNVQNENLIAFVSWTSSSLAITCFSINELTDDFQVEFRIEAKKREVSIIKQVFCLSTHYISTISKILCTWYTMDNSTNLFCTSRKYYTVSAAHDFCQSSVRRLP